MSSILVRDLDPDVVERLKERARLNKRSLQAELRHILETEAAAEGRRRNYGELARRADAIRRRSGPQKSDSTEILRKVREP
jgi:plasmid stability protein